MITKEKAEAFWNSIDVTSIPEIKELFEGNTNVFLEFLIGKILDKVNFEIGFLDDGRQSGSTLMYGENQKEIELRLKKNSSYDLILLVEDMEGEIVQFKTKLSDEEVKLIPESIRKQMYSVREIERPITFLNTPTE